MIEVKEGQFAISEDRWGFSSRRADKVTPKTIRTLTWGNRYHQTDRSTVVAVCNTPAAAESLLARLDNARRRFADERTKANDAFREAVAPFEKVRDAAIEEARVRFRLKVERLAANG